MDRQCWPWAIFSHARNENFSCTVCHRLFRRNCVTTVIAWHLGNSWIPETISCFRLVALSTRIADQFHLEPPGGNKILPRYTEIRALPLKYGDTKKLDIMFFQMLDCGFHGINIKCDMMATNIAVARNAVPLTGAFILEYLEVQVLVAQKGYTSNDRARVDVELVFHESSSFVTKRRCSVHDHATQDLCQEAHCLIQIWDRQSNVIEASTTW